MSTMGKAHLFSGMFVLLVGITEGLCQTIDQVNNLSTTLLQGYNKHTRPINDQTKAVQIDVYMWLFALRVFDELLGKLSTGILFRLSWTDESLSWDPKSHHNIRKITVSQRDVWTPLLTVSNPHSQMKELGDNEWVTIQVFPDGRMEWLPVTMVDTACSIDTRFYPFDSQSCTIEMITFGHAFAEVNVTLPDAALNTSMFEGHATWKILSTSINNHHVGDAALLKITLKLQRRPMFIVVNFLVPILTLALLNPLAFMLPADSGERIGFSMTILLSLSVFMTILGDYLPKNAEPMSLLAYMLMSLYICSSGMVVLVIVSMKIYAIPDSVPVSDIARAFVLLFHCVKPQRSRVPSVDLEEANGELYVPVPYARPKSSVSSRQHIDDVDHNGDYHGEKIVTWRDVSKTIDKWVFVFTYSVIGLAILVFMAVIRVR